METYAVPSRFYVLWFLAVKLVLCQLNDATVLYRASHVRFISEFILYATKNTNYADHLIPFIMCFNLVINVGM
jgi:hypothetical protein